MQPITLHNSLSRTKEIFTPIKSDTTIGMYTCGPTVYDFVSIGNWRTYTLGDFVYRTLSFLGYKVTYVINITDVGHLTGDNEGDADTGEDRLEKAKKREGKSAWDVAKMYGDDFIAGYKLLNLSQPKLFSKATEHIEEQIVLIQKLESTGLTYAIDDGIYFDTKAYEAKGYTYGELSNLDQIRAGARVHFNTQKRDERDFALWKFSPNNEKRDMEWNSPWGVGFPGWHIECSAMSMKYLGQQFDIHVGGEDLKSTHHPNEIAQSQGATGCAPFVKYWIHGAFLQVDGGRMGKSLGNAYNLHDIESKGYSPLALRLFYMTGHYHSPLNFTWEALDAAQVAYTKLIRLARELKKSWKKEEVADVSYVQKFTDAITNDFNMPQALALTWELIKDESLPESVRFATLIAIDAVLGFNLESLETIIEIPEDVQVLIEKRDQARNEKNWLESDSLREEIETKGYIVLDTKYGTSVQKK